MITNKDIRVEGSNLILNGEKHPLDPAVNALTKRANIVQGKFSALNTKLDAFEALEKTASGNPISLSGVAAAYAISNLMTIEPIQSGSGDPSPTNVRPISGISKATVQTTDGTDTNTATITLGQTVYGGSVNFKTGEVTVTHGYHKITSSDEFIKSTASGIQSGRMGYWLSRSGSGNLWLDEIKFSGGDTNPNKISMLSNCYDIGTTSATQVIAANNFAVGIGQVIGPVNVATNLWFNVSATDCPDTQSFINWITSINFEVVYPLAKPTTLTLTPAELELLKGNNTVSGNGANINLSYIGR